MLWGGRFAAGPHPDMLRLTRSVEVDLFLLPYDLLATRAHARALQRAGLLNDEEVDSISAALDDIGRAWHEGSVDVEDRDEDVHSLVERLLTERLGDTGRRIHAGRSRNDLVATDLRLWCKERAGEVTTLIADLLETIASMGTRHSTTVMPGYTHLQRAQPVSLGFHLLAHGFALLRDGRRFTAAAHAADVGSLGAGALAGTTLPIDPIKTASDLGFTATFDNAMDVVSDRDFLCDLVYASALCGVHLSRLAEEIVQWASAEFGFAALSDEWSTGSSMMPQKRNPDLAELIRGRAASQIGEVASLLGLLKGLPLAYDRDLQEDKSIAPAAVERVARSVTGMTHLLNALRFDEDRMRQAAAEGAAWATDVAEALVGRGVPFRDAHGAAGRLVTTLEARGASLGELSVEELKRHHPLFEAVDAELAEPAASLARRRARGGTAPERIIEQAETLGAGAAALRSVGGPGDAPSGASRFPDEFRAPGE